MDRELEAVDPKKYTSPQGVEYSPRLLRDHYVERFGEDAVKVLEQQFQVPELDKKGKPKRDKTVLYEASSCWMWTPKVRCTTTLPV